MGIILAFIIGCLATLWWRAKANNKESSRVVQKATSEGNQYLSKAIVGLRTAEQRGAKIYASKVLKKPVIDDELKDVLLEHMIDQIKKGKIKIIVDVD